MNLMKRLEKFDDDTELHIGSKSAFFFMGTKNEFYNELYKLNKEWEEKMRNSVKSAERRYTVFKETPIDFTKPAYKKVFTGVRMIEVEMSKEERKEDKANRLKILKFNAENAKAVYNRFTKFETREITGVYKSLYEDSVIVLVEGDECGRFWLKDEWDAYKNGKLIIIDSEEEEDEGYDI